MWILLGKRKVPWLSGELFYQRAEKLISQCLEACLWFINHLNCEGNVIQSFWNLIYSCPRTCCHVAFSHSGSGSWIARMLSSKTPQWPTMAWGNYSLLKNIKCIIEISLYQVCILRLNCHIWTHFFLLLLTWFRSCWKIGQYWISQGLADTFESCVLTSPSWNNRFSCMSWCWIQAKLFPNAAATVL